MNKSKRFMALFKKATQGQDILSSTPKQVPGAPVKPKGLKLDAKAGKLAPKPKVNLLSKESGEKDKGLTMLFGKDREGATGEKYDFSMDFPKKKKSPKLQANNNSQYLKKLKAN